jgi:hypothetical protein
LIKTVVVGLLKRMHSCVLVCLLVAAVLHGGDDRLRGCRKQVFDEWLVVVCMQLHVAVKLVVLGFTGLCESLRLFC